ncbi:hypothetical protein HDA40_000785 [Hamadaea flava]|uniref:Uncharacterized protein n=1 Tax=Hamadaea flava TaxID=1742688 RepID=A0ABV8LTF4_9ACTN|nr:hypothetical protein [Hamadaea flava]MCP2322278.1 hypothetical protein [Hamadaea flava]
MESDDARDRKSGKIMLDRRRHVAGSQAIRPIVARICQNSSCGDADAVLSTVTSVAGRV